MFEEDIDNLGTADEDLLNENIDGDIASDKENDQEEENNENGESKGVKIEPKIVRKRNIIRPLERMMGERGLQCVGEYYRDIKYKGKHHEREDLNEVMRRLQHWAHRALPTMKFDDALTIVEGLTKKKQVQSHMNKYRLDMLDPVVVQHEEPQAEFNQINDEPIDEFDDLLSDQIEQMTRVQKNKTADRSHQFNQLKDSTMADSLGCHEMPKSPKNVLNSERMALIAENRRKAMERLQQKKLQESVQSLDEDL